jgi:hypothetical protein
MLRYHVGSLPADLAQALLEEGKPLPVPSADAQWTGADLIELVPLSVYEGIMPR